MLSQLLDVDTGPAVNLWGPFFGQNGYSHDRQGTALLAYGA